MKGKFFSVFAVVAILGLLGGVGDARAICGETRTMVTFSGQFGSTYLYFAPDANLDNTAVTGPVIGRWWATGNFAIRGGEGTNCQDEQWVIAGPGTSKGVFCYIGGDAGFGLCDNTGACPAADVHVLIETTRSSGANSQFGLYRVAFTPAAVHAYDLSKDATNNTAADVPRPKVLSSSRAGTNVNLTVRLEPIPAGAFDGAADGFSVANSITGYRLMEATAPGPADVGRNPTSWTLKSTHTYTGSNVDTPTTVDCSNLLVDRFLAVQLVFDNGQVNSDYVGASTRIECDPNLADPSKFKLIKKSASKPGLAPKSNR